MKPAFASLRVAPLVLVLAGCGDLGRMDPAPLPEIAPGTIYHYEGLTNTVVEGDGWAYTYEDGQGRSGRRVGVFLSDDPRAPAEVDSAALAALWPLEVGRETVVDVARHGEEWEWEFRVTGTETLEVPMGTFDTYVVQAAQVPRVTRTPGREVSTLHTWWYSPEVGAVVRFRTTYLTGPAQGRVVQAALERVVGPGSDGAG